MPVSDEHTSRQSLYECRACQRRVEDPNSRVCDCGGNFKNIGVSRRK